MPHPKSDGRPTLRCNFCGTPEADTADLVAGPDCYICDVCIGLAQEIVQAAKERRAKAGVPKV